MTAMTMYTRKGDTWELIPADHEKVLEQYRDSMPIVWEPQGGDTIQYYPLIDVDEEPYGSPEPSRLERLALTTARRMKRERLGEEPAATPEFEQLAKAAIRAYLADLYQFAAAVNFDYGDDQGDFRKAAEKDVTAAAQKLSRAVTRAAREVVAEQPAVVLGPCLDETIGR